MQAIEFTGMLLLALCAVPQAYNAIKTGKAEGISIWMLTMWLFGELFAIAYVIGTYSRDLLLIANYVINFVAVIVLLRYKLFPRGANSRQL